MPSRHLKGLCFHPSKEARCVTCSLSSLCLPLSLNLEDIDQLDRIIKRRQPLKKGEYLFHQGDNFDCVYAVRSGSIKNYAMTNEGEEQITNFYLPSELVGLDGVDCDTYPVSAKALETTTVCEIPFSRLEELAVELPELRAQILRIMSKELRDDKQMMMLLSKKNAEERVATFLSNLSTRFKRRGYSPYTFRLPMSRNEIGNYLGLAVETVSRVFTRFQNNQLIAVNGKEVHILDMEQLGLLAGLVTQESSPRIASSS
ncbi:CRP/FNR family transcriptional regulator, anaerobic regulatory protein [Allopseudospirillum japonicum]|uniref:CRP/FNR family transcriptional regulator, anaerobic regulatory protein n=1 Tax=Allopseudospirillum japonicum TaxID=64971 RepID=A0A1H6TRD3_9GAMM|nr:fumarate/nitrate reduction transcriptional regulator Fnr [Allopseudospirillum japonicum]SEI78755.1 CRP/FNR family transcriptional regulator, anaerobic regulatory protein [Allopseudospirillum japonicum]